MSTEQPTSPLGFNPLLSAVSKREFDILDHTINRAANGLYCGDSDEMKRLVQAGLMECAGRKSFVPEPYFRITASGREAWKANRPPELPRHKVTARKRRARERYERYLRLEPSMSFGEWIKLCR